MDGVSLATSSSSSSFVFLVEGAAPLKSGSHFGFPETASSIRLLASSPPDVSPLKAAEVGSGDLHRHGAHTGEAVRGAVTRLFLLLIACRHQLA